MVPNAEAALQRLIESDPKNLPSEEADENKPEKAVDSCFDTEGTLIYAGDDAWQGILDSRQPGSCTQAFPLYSTSRIVAGGPITGDIFKCHLQPLDEAIKKGVYGSIELSPNDKTRLEDIFPEGVCDYTQGDKYKPTT